MTICIAAIASNHNKDVIICATDRMISTSGLGQFEHDIEKYKLLGSNTVAMLSGDPLLFEELTKITPKEKSFKQIRDAIYHNFQNKRKEQIQREILDTFGLGRQSIIDMLEKEVNNKYTDKILDQISKFELETGMLLAGFENGRAQICRIDEAYTGEYRDIGFETIGSGDNQALNTLLFQRQSRKTPVLTALYNVYKAKRNSEVKQGVGKETDMLVLTEKRVMLITPSQFEILRNIYEEELESGKHHKDLNKIKLGI
jgi:hypothetical protein